MTSSIEEDSSASVISELDREGEFLTDTKIEIVAEKDEIVFLKANSDVKHNWEKLLFNNGLKPYLVTASPTNSTYDPLYSSKGGLADVMKFLKNYWGIRQAFGTTEKLDVQKVHHHLIVWDSDLRAKFDKYPKKSDDKATIIIGGKHHWGLHIQPIDRLTSTYEYITKECRKRVFVKLSDYRIMMNWTMEEKSDIVLKRRESFKGSKNRNANLVLKTG